MESGRNNGVTGLIDLPGLGTGALFECHAYGYKSALTIATKPRRGRGDNAWEKARPIGSGGSLAISARIQLTGWPMPTLWKGQVGTVLLQLDEGRTESHTVRVDSFARGYSEQKGDVHDVTLGCAIIDEPVYAGFADADHPQPAATDPAKGDQEQWGEGTTKTHDLQGILTAATRLTDVWGGTLPDTDSGEGARLAAAAAAAQPPLQYLKLKSATFTRDSLDGGTIEELWSLTDSAEDLLNPLTRTILDANHLGSQAVAAAFNATPATPGGDSFVARTTTTSETNDNKILTVVEFGLRDLLDDAQMPGTLTEADLASLADKGTIVRVTSSSTPPAAPAAPAGQHVGTDSVQVNRIRWQHTFHYANSTTAQELLFKDTVTTADPTQLDDEDQQAALNGSATPPATPTPATAGLKLRRRTSRRVTGTPVQWEHVFYFARTTTQEDVENPGTFTQTDPKGRESQGAQTLVYDPAGGVPGPSAPAGQIAVSTRIQELNDGRNAVRYGFGVRSSEDEVTFSRTRRLTDLAGVDQEHLICVSFTTGGVPVAPTPPGGMQIADYFDVPDTNPGASNLSYRVYRLAFVSNDQRLTLARYESGVDPRGLETKLQSAVLWDSAGAAPLDPGLPTGLKLRFRTDVAIPTHPTKQIRVYRWAKTDSVDERVLPRTVLAQDPANLASRGTLAAFNAVPPVPAGYKTRFIRGFFENGTDLIYELEYGLNSHADDLVYDSTAADADAFEGVRYEAAAVVPSSAAETAYQIAAGIHFSRRNDSTFEGVRARKINDNEALIVIRTRDDQVIVRYRFWGTGWQQVPAYYDGSNVWLYLRQKVKAGTGLWRMELAEQYLSGARGEFTVERRRGGNSVDLNESRMGTSNGGAFLGLSSGKVAYTGIAAGATNIGVPAPRVSRIVYGFAADSLGFLNMGSASMGWQFTAADLTARAEQSWQKASDLGMTTALLSGADYSGFIA